MRNNNSQEISHRFAFRHKAQCRFVDFFMIAYIHSLPRRVMAHSQKQSFPSSMLLKALEDELLKFGFVRITPTIIINQSQIKSYSEGQNEFLDFVNGESLPCITSHSISI